jgi:hypothetical protein
MLAVSSLKVAETGISKVRAFASNIDIYHVD